jgi:myo-inositol-1(or 4)-monophosphatase
LLAEESGLHTPNAGNTVKQQLESGGPLWIVDPLDGTYNYTRGIPWTCVSIALWHRQRSCIGVIYDFNRDEMWTGRPGEGAFCNGTPVRVSEITDRGQGLLCTGFPAAMEVNDQALADMFREVQSFKKVRMIGSAAMAMVFVARGWAEAYREQSSWIWDIAAGAALVEAAGGEACITRLRKDGRVDILASNGRGMFP